MKAVNFVLTIQFIALFFLISCSPDYKKEIIGRWRDNSNRVVVFKENGTCQSLFKTSRYSIEGNKIFFNGEKDEKYAWEIIEIGDGKLIYKGTALMTGGEYEETLTKIN